ncbi:protein translocase subunit SecF [Fodinicola acaciae]|uniref:protein translocase subunit SecF n=1 Tax=Fodinicola acaciae TaxID=2681555 RepID=UPI0013D401A2|nr:protein translocase subunit SecF [Fodinicola acaciae]
MPSFAQRVYRGEAGIDFVGRRRTWYLISLAILVVALASFLIRGFHWGIEFEGGVSFQVPATVAASQEVAENAVRNAKISGGAIEVISTQTVRSTQGAKSDSYLVRIAPISETQANEALTSIAAELKTTTTNISESRVSASWGGQITQSALIALAVFLALLIIYLAFRYEWKMAVGAIIALAHDLLITAGVYSLVGFEVTPNTVIGLLTILGFSLYDTVVVFDRVAENTKGILGGSRYSYSEAANLAVNQTLMRSINTSIIALLPVAGLLFIGAGLLGAGTLKDLGLVLFIGMIAGAYSSIFLAAPITAELKEREPRYKALHKRVAARRAAASGVTSRTSETTATGKAAAKSGTSLRKADAEPEAADDADEPVGAGASKASAGASNRPVQRKRPGGKPGRPSGSKRRR